MAKNLIADKTKKKGLSIMAKPAFGISGAKDLFKGARPQGDYTNIDKVATTNMAINPAQFYSPELTPETWLLPKSRLEIYKWGLYQDEDLTLETNNSQITTKQVKDIQVGEKILNCKGEFQEILEKIERTDYTEVYKITPLTSPSIKLTWDHEVSVIRPPEKEYDRRVFLGSLKKGFINPQTQWKWVNAKDVKIGDYVTIPKYKVIKEVESIDLAKYIHPLSAYKYTINDNEINLQLGKVNYTMPRFLPLNPEILEFFGWYLAEGYVEEEYKNTVLTLCIDEQDVAESLVNILKKYFNIPAEKVYIAEHNGHIRVKIFNHILSYFIYSNFNTGSKYKRIPAWLLNAPIDILKPFMVGWCRGDGSLVKIKANNNRTAFTLCTVSKDLAYTGYQAFLKLGILPSFRKREQSIEKISGSIKGKVKSVAPFAYTLGFTGDKINVLFPGKYEAPTCTKYIEDENYFYVPVMKIELIPIEDKCYCFVTEDHTIQVPFVTHNCRIYFNLDPYIQSILTMHSQYPISKFRLQYKDKDTEDFFNRKMFEDCHIDWVSFLERLSLSYYVYGEGIVWGSWNSIKDTWDDLILIDPALIDYQEDALTGKSIMSLIPTQELKQLVAQALRDGSTDLPADYIACVQENKQIPLDTEGVEPNYLTGRKYVPPTAFMFSRLLSPGSTRGVSIIQQLFKVMIYSDKIRLAQVAAADSFYNPIQLWSIGSYTGDPKTSVIPTEADLQQYRDMIEQATMTPPFSIYVPPFVKYEALGVQGKLLSVYEDLGYVENCILVGLGVNKNIITGQGPSFSSGKQISLYRLIKMYKSFRLKLEAFMKKYIILPIAKAADLRDEHSNYIIPEIKWEESLQPEQDKDLFDSLFKLYDKGLVSTQTLMEHFMIPLDMKLESERMMAERRSVWDKGTDRLGAKVFRDDMKDLNNAGKPLGKSDLGAGSTGGTSGGAGAGAAGESLDLGKPYPGSAGSDKSYLPPPTSGGAGLDKGEETPATPEENI